MDAFTSEQLLQRIRFDEATQRGSVFDTIQLVTGCKRPGQTLKGIVSGAPDLVEKIELFKFPGKGQRATKVAPLPTLVEIAMLCPGTNAARFRMAGARTYCRLLAGDQTLAQEIEERNEEARLAREQEELKQEARARRDSMLQSAENLLRMYGC